METDDDKAADAGLVDLRMNFKVRTLQRLEEEG